MRVLAFALALIAASGVAHADGDDDDDEDEDGEFVPLPNRSVALSFVGHGTRLGGHSEGGMGSSLELALGHGRWQYFGEGALSSSSVTATAATGRMAQLGIGARWLARQFRPDGGGGVELFLLSRLGMQRFYLDDGTRLGRPELAIGFGVQGRLYKRPRIAFRLDARVLMSPNDREACRPDCMDASSTGFSTGVGLAW